MADNYLEKRYEEVFGSSSSRPASVAGKPSLETLLRHNRSYRGYDRSYVVHPRQLEAMVRVNTLVASSVNMQSLRFHLVCGGEEASKVNSLIKMGRALPELNLPFPGTEPEAFIVVCGTVAENASVCIDLGISLQSMLLKAVELGLGGLIVRNFDHAALKEALALPLEPLAVVAVGKPAEKIELVPVRAGSDLRYYRRDGIHFVPKIVPDDLLV